MSWVVEGRRDYKGGNGGLIVEVVNVSRLQLDRISGSLERPRFTFITHRVVVIVYPLPQPLTLDHLGLWSELCPRLSRVDNLGIYPPSVLVPLGLLFAG